MANPPQTPKQPAGKNTAYTMQRRLVATKTHEFEILSNFDKEGYRNREDITILPPGVMVLGSYNVLTNVSGRIGVTKGYTQDGNDIAGVSRINSSFDWTKITDNDTHVRAGGGQLQFRYKNPTTNAIQWVTFFTVSPSTFNYTTFNILAQDITVMLFVNGSNNIFEWSGAVASYASSTSTTITLQGTQTWDELGFYDTGTRSVIIDGTSYSYTGGESTTTLTGVSPDPTGAGIAVGDAITNAVITTNNSAMTDINDNLNNSIIGNLYNQIYIGGNNSSIVYVSKTNDYTDYSMATPRGAGDGYSAPVYGIPTAFINQGDTIYITSDKDNWYQAVYTQTTTSTTYDASGSPVTVSNVYETLAYQPLKTSALQAAQSQAAVTKIANDIIYLSYEPIINSLGPVTNILTTPQITDLSYSIVNDMNKYDFTDACMIYFRQFLYISVPKQGLIRVYNMTQPKVHYWEAPLTFPIGRFSIIDGNLYGHGYSTSQTFKLFDGYTFNGASIPAAAYFSYNQFGTRAYPKNFNLFYLEGYITSNCTLTYGLNYDIDGCQTQRTYTIDGADKQIVCITSDDASLGKTSLGKRPLSGLMAIPDSPESTNTGLPPKFRAIKQLSKFPFYELQVFFESLGNDQQWEIIGFGPAASPATEGPVSIQY